MPEQSARVELLKWARYQKAQEAKSRWTAEEKEAKSDLLASLGYDPADGKPAGCEVFALDGTHLGSIAVGSRKGLDINYLRDRHPEVYAECEKTTFPISVKQPK